MDLSRLSCLPPRARCLFFCRELLWHTTALESAHCGGCSRRRGGPPVPTLGSATRGDAGLKPRLNTNVTPNVEAGEKSPKSLRSLPSLGTMPERPHSGRTATAAKCPYSTSPRPSLDRPSLGLLFESIHSTQMRAPSLAPTRWPWLLQDRLCPLACMHSYWP